MTTPKPMTARQINAKCHAIVAAGVRRAYDTALTGLADLEKNPGLEVAGLVMAATFSESIQHGCTVLGAVTGERPDVARFTPDEHHAFTLLPSTISIQTRIDARRIHRAMARRTREFVTTNTAGDIEQAHAIYQRVAAAGQAGTFVFTLWATATVVERSVAAVAAIGRTCPTCQEGALYHLEIGQSAVYTCGHLEQLNDLSGSANVRAGRQEMFDQVSAILRKGRSR